MPERGEGRKRWTPKKGAAKALDTAGPTPTTPDTEAPNAEATPPARKKWAPKGRTEAALEPPALSDETTSNSEEPDENGEARTHTSAQEQVREGEGTAEESALPNSSGARKKWTPKAKKS